MFNKILAGVVMGIVVAILSAVVVGMAVGAGERGGGVGLWAALIGFILTFVLALTAARGRFAWGRGMLVSGLLCFGMPLASILFTAVAGATHLSTVPSDGASQAGATIGVGLAGTALTIVSAVIGFFLGLIFIVVAYFLLRTPKQAPV